MTVLRARFDALVAAYSGTSERELAATLLGAIAVAGAMVGLATYVLPHPPGTDFVTPSFAFAASLLAGLALLRHRRRARWWMIGAVVALGSGVITVAMVAVPERTAVYAPYYVLISIFAFYFMRPRVAFAQLGLIAILYGGAVAIERPAGSAEIWSNGVGIALLVGLLIWALRVRIKGLVAAQQLAAETDALTELPNRRAFDRWIETAITSAAGHHSPLALVLVDLNGFKRINDTLGHLAGDAALVRIGKVIPDAVRPDDRVFRFGGDEFALILPGADRQTAEAVADRVMVLIEKAFADVHEQLTASVGVALRANGDGSQELIASADARLYASKRRSGGLEAAIRDARHEHETRRVAG